MASVLQALAVKSTWLTELILMVLAAVISLYALVVYFRRLYLLERALPYGYQDHAGPIILTLSIVAGILTLLYFSISQRNMSLPKSVTPQAEKCVQHKFSGVSMLDFQPSDVIVDFERDLFLVPSLTDIKALPRQSEAYQPRLETLATIDRMDVEAMTYGDDGTLYAISEDPESSILLAFRWMPNTETLRHQQIQVGRDEHIQLVGKWRLKGVANAEGMVFLPEDPARQKSARILVSSDATDLLRSNVNVFTVPTEFNLDETTLHPVHHLNSGLLSQGFLPNASAKISAMTVFDGILYILHDNMRVIRGWEMESGVMVSEWTTPPVGGEFDKQWEGIALEGTKAGGVVLHMALDTPPQLWSFQLERLSVSEDSWSTAVWSLPSCANTT